MVTASATPQQYNPLTKRYVDVTGKNPTISWTSSDTAIVKVDSTGKSADRQVRRHRDDHGRDHH